MSVEVLRETDMHLEVDGVGYWRWHRGLLSCSMTGDSIKVLHTKSCRHTNLAAIEVTKSLVFCICRRHWPPASSDRFHTARARYSSSLRINPTGGIDVEYRNLG